MRLLLLFSVLALIFVNGWTDAPNAIAGVVAAGSMPYRTAARMAAACNLSGALLFCLLGGQVAKTIQNLSGFSQAAEGGLCALAGCFLSVVLFAAAAWALGDPHQREPWADGWNTGQQSGIGGRKCRLLAGLATGAGRAFSFPGARFFSGMDFVSPCRFPTPPDGRSPPDRMAEGRGSRLRGDGTADRTVKNLPPCWGWPGQWQKTVPLPPVAGRTRGPLCCVQLSWGSAPYAAGGGLSRKLRSKWLRLTSPRGQRQISLLPQHCLFYP